MLAGWVVLLATVLVSGYINDHLSCERSVIVRSSLSALSNVDRTTAFQRSASAVQEASSDPDQAVLDRRSATTLFQAAAALSIEQTGCSGLFPAAR